MVGNRQPANSRNQLVDQFRAIAALVVVGSHSLAINKMGWQPFGWLAVSFFFVISGYLITTILMRALDRGAPEEQLRSLGRFYWRRFLRIAPPLFLTLLFLQVCYPSVLVPNSGYYWFFMANAAFAEIGYSPFGSGHLWSIAVEEQFYLLWPLVVMVFMRLSRVNILIFLMFTLGMTLRWATALGWIDWFQFPEVFTGYSVPALMVGAGLYCFRNCRWNGLCNWATAFSVLGFLLCVWVFNVGLAWGFGFWYELRYNAFLAVAGLSVFYALTHPTMPNSKASNIGNGLTLLGRISYGIYLFHYPILLVLTRQFGLNAFEATIVVYPLTISLALLSHRYLEQPILQWRNHHWP